MKNDPSNIRVTFRGREFTLSVHRYVDARHVALRLSDARTGEHAHWASMIFAPEANLRPDQVLVQDAGETRGMLQALQAAGVVRATGERGRWHGHLLPIADLLIEPPAQLRLPDERSVPREDWLLDWLTQEAVPEQERPHEGKGKEKDREIER